MIDVDLRDIELSNAETAQFVIARKLIASLKENNPDALSEALDVQGIDVRDVSTNKLLGYYIKNLGKAVEEGFDYRDENDAMMEALPESVRESLAPSTLSYPEDSPFSGAYADKNFFNAQGENRSSCNQSDCSAITAAQNSGDYSGAYMMDCFDWCLINEGGWSGALCGDTTALNTGAATLCEYESTVSQFFGIFTTTLGNIASDIGWDNIWGSIMGTNDGGVGDTNIYVDGEGDEDDEKDGFNWLALGVGVLVTVSVVGGIIYFVRKSKAD